VAGAVIGTATIEGHPYSPEKGHPDSPAAILRSRNLLLSCLDQKQKDDFLVFGFFSVGGSSRRLYDLEPNGPACLVECFKVSKRKGVRHRLIGRYCVWGGLDLPAYDTVLAAKILIEANEREFLRTAYVRYGRKPLLPPSVDGILIFIMCPLVQWLLWVYILYLCF